LRHTTAIWLIQNGASVWEAAGFLGMSEKTLRETYGHHHPDFMRGAVDAIGRRRPQPEKLVAPLASDGRQHRDQTISAPPFTCSVWPVM
jgi:hypothetical protein